MKQKLKAFTLIELIIVMAILAILMSALMNFYRPIRETYVDSTMIENMRTTQDGILEYLTENVRYAECMTIIDEGAAYEYTYTDGLGNEQTKKATVNNPKDAYTAFCRNNGFVDNTGSPDETKYSETLENVRTIVINRAQSYNVNGIRDSGDYAYSGRIITNIDGGFRARDFGASVGDRTLNASATGNSYMALGGAYYGRSNYVIYIDIDKTWNSANGEYKGSLVFDVRNALANSGGVIKSDKDYGNTTVSVSNGEVTLTSEKAALTKNLKAIDYFMVNNKKPGDSGAYPAGSVLPTGAVQSGSTNTYIVFTEPDDER